MNEPDRRASDVENDVDVDKKMAEAVQCGGVSFLSFIVSALAAVSRCPHT
jgi:hypothetical protein